METCDIVRHIFEKFSEGDDEGAYELCRQLDYDSPEGLQSYHDEMGNDLVVAAAANDCSAALECLLVNGLDPNRIPPSGYSALSRALDPSVKKVLCTHGARLARYEHLVRVLSEQGSGTFLSELEADPRVLDCSHPYLGSWLRIAAEFGGDVDLLLFLIEHGLDVNEHTPGSGETPLHSAYGEESISHVLIDHGANIEAKDSSQRTPLHYTILNDGSNLGVLLEHGADVNAQDSTGQTPLDLAIELNYPGYSEVKRTLREWGGKRGRELRN